MKSEAACQVREPIARPVPSAFRPRAARPARSASATPPAPAELPQETEGQRRRVAQHVHLFRQGDPARSVYQLVDGAVMLYKLLPDGRRSIVEVLIGPDDVFGISSLPINDCSAQTIVASEIVAYDRATLETSPELARRVTTRLQVQFCAMHEHAVLLGRKTALERVTSFIMHCVPQRGGFNCLGPRGEDDSAHVRLGMTREEIADYLGLTLETVSRAFSKLRKRGVVTIDQHGQVCVNDVCRMCALTGAH